jgi:hypothetical protein
LMASPEAIYNWRRLDCRITTSGSDRKAACGHSCPRRAPDCEPRAAHHEKALPDEAASVSRLGMTYIRIPVDFQSPTDDDFDQFCAAMEQLKEVPVHVHCVANHRGPPSSAAIAATCLAWAKPRRVDGFFGARRDRRGFSWPDPSQRAQLNGGSHRERHAMNPGRGGGGLVKMRSQVVIIGGDPSGLLVDSSCDHGIANVILERRYWRRKNALTANSCLARDRIGTRSLYSRTLSSISSSASRPRTSVIKRMQPRFSRSF